MGPSIICKTWISCPRAGIACGHSTHFLLAVVFPALVAVYAAYLWRLEHLGHNWNLLMTAPVPRFGVFFAKFAAVVQLVLLTQGLTFLLYLLCGKVFAHLEGWPPVETFWF